jgi:hypothetical protein
MIGEKESGTDKEIGLALDAVPVDPHCPIPSGEQDHGGDGTLRAEQDQRLASPFAARRRDVLGVESAAFDPLGLCGSSQFLGRRRAADGAQ